MEVSMARLVRLILYLHYGLNVEFDDDGYGELQTFKKILGAMATAIPKSKLPCVADPATLRTERPAIFNWIYLKEPAVESQLDENTLNDIFANVRCRSSKRPLGQVSSGHGAKRHRPASNRLVCV